MSTPTPAPTPSAPTPPTIDEAIRAADERRAQGNWIPACGGAERRFRSRSGKTLLYCWQPSSGRHAYLDCGSDIILTDEEAAAALAMF